MNFELIKSTLQECRQAAALDDDRWGLDRGSCWHYPNTDFRKTISAYMASLKKSKRPIVHVDIAGRAHAFDFGVDISYSFALNKHPKFFKRENHSFFSGDIFNGRDFANFLDILREREHFPSLVTFAPHAGFNKVPYNDVTNAILAKRFCQVVEILDFGGLLYMEKPFNLSDLGDFFRGLEQSKYQRSLEVKKLSRRLGCKMQISPSIYGPNFLVKKTRKVNSHNFKRAYRA